MRAPAGIQKVSTEIGGSPRAASITTDMFNRTYKLGLEDKLRLFSRHGFRFIHWCDDWNCEVFYAKDDIERIRQLIDIFSLRCIDVHGVETAEVHIASQDAGAVNRFVRLLENRIEFCSAVGGDVVVVHPPTGEGNPDAMKRKLERSLQVFDRVRPLCEDLGIALAVENCHRFGVEVLSYYFERYPPEFVGLCFDSGHANLHGDTEELMRLDGRLNALHLHDNRGKEDDHQPPFWGTIDWGHVMRWIGRVAYSKPINFEIVHRAGLFGGTPEEFMEFTVRSVRRTLALMEQ